jgi:hypothetical protein
VVTNFFHLRMMEATVFFGTFNAAEMFWYPSPDHLKDDQRKQDPPELDFRSHSKGSEYFYKKVFLFLYKFAQKKTGIMGDCL